MITQPHPTTSTPPADPTAPADLIDIEWQPRRFRSAVVIASAVGVTIGVIVAVMVALSLISAFAGPAARPWSGLMIVGFLATFFFIAAIAWDRHRRARLNRLLKRLIPHSSGAALADQLSQPDPQFALLHDSYGQQRLARALLSAGSAGLALRLSQPNKRTAIVPLDVTFEPLPLDETHDAVRALMDDAKTPTAGEHPVAIEERRSTDAIRRHITLSGGLGVIGFVAFFFVRAGIDAWYAGRMTLEFGFWVAVVLIMLLFPPGRAISRSITYVVPGGLVVRRRGAWALVPRAKAVLVTSGLPRQGARTVTVAHGDELIHLVVTEREQQFLLRAWLSPVPPPSEELLANLSAAE